MNQCTCSFKAVLSNHICKFHKEKKMEEEEIVEMMYCPKCRTHYEQRLLGKSEKCKCYKVDKSNIGLSNVENKYSKTRTLTFVLLNVLAVITVAFLIVRFLK